MSGWIAVEEHFITPALLKYVPALANAGPTSRVRRALEDVGQTRLAMMDELGIERTILSLAGPGVQGELDSRVAATVASDVNDLLAEIVNRHPDRFSGFAALPLQDPAAATKELDRAVTELGFCGALVNGYSSRDNQDTGLYYDAEQFLPFWERVEALGVPIYLHPRDPLPDQRRIYEGYPHLLGAPWAFGAETAVHALRLMLSGLFDRFPELTIVLGHLGETLPFVLNRAQAHYRDKKLPIQKEVTTYFRENFYITTSGHFHTPTFLGAMLEIGVERILFAIDFPFADEREAVDWFERLPISPRDKVRIGRENALKAFNLA